LLSSPWFSGLSAAAALVLGFLYFQDVVLPTEEGRLSEASRMEHAVRSERTDLDTIRGLGYTGRSGDDSTAARSRTLGSIGYSASSESEEVEAEEARPEMGMESRRALRDLGYWDSDAARPSSTPETVGGGDHLLAQDGSGPSSASAGETPGGSAGPTSPAGLRSAPGSPIGPGSGGPTTGGGGGYRGPGDSAPPGEVAPGTIYVNRGSNPGISVVDLNGFGEGPEQGTYDLNNPIVSGHDQAQIAPPGFDVFEAGTSGLEGSIALPRQRELEEDADGDNARRDLSSRPNRVSAGESYERLPENPFVPVLVDSRSTFSIDVDTASYANVRRFLRQGQLPPQSAVRIEEMVNAFSYSYAGPTDEHPFAVHAEIVSAPWAAGHKLLRVGLQGQLPSNENPVGRNLVFLVDVSGSMRSTDKLPLVLRSMELLVGALQPRDTIGIVTYAGNSGIALQPTPVSEKEVILAAIQSLQSGGSTNGAAGIIDAYRLAQEHFVEGGVNRVVLATDGDFNVGIQSRAGLEQLITQKRETGVFLSVLGFGQGNLKDSQMELLADKGNGNYSYIDSVREARKVLVRNLDGTLETIAKDVKIQIEFNPQHIQSFRLIGYENRMLAHRDFNDDRKDAGEIGAGHSVTALYELIPVGADLAGTPPLRYQQPGVPNELTDAAQSGEALTIQLRYKRPDSYESTLLALPVMNSETTFEEASQETRFAAAVASFGMQLRGSEHVGAAGFEAVRMWAKGAIGTDSEGDRAEFLTLVDWAIQASLGTRTVR
ncbi:MAG: Ca-activated chloride channel family protein, partial [Planctomycetota bacterium]